MSGFINRNFQNNIGFSNKILVMTDFLSENASMVFASNSITNINTWHIAATALVKVIRNKSKRLRVTSSC